MISLRIWAVRAFFSVGLRRFRLQGSGAAGHGDLRLVAVGNVDTGFYGGVDTTSSYLIKSCPGRAQAFTVTHSSTHWPLSSAFLWFIIFRTL